MHTEGNAFVEKSESLFISCFQLLSERPSELRRDCGNVTKWIVIVSCGIVCKIIVNILKDDTNLTFILHTYKLLGRLRCRNNLNVNRLYSHKEIERGTGEFEGRR